METLQRTANRGSISTGYDIENSLKLEADNSEAIAATNSTQSGNRKTWTFSTWVKRTEIDMSGSFGLNALFYAASSGIAFMNTDELRILLYTDGGLAGSFTLSQLFRDTSAWYHIVLTVDSTEATSTNRVKLWLNGEQVTDFSTETYPNLNDEFQFGKAQSAAPIRIGNAYWGTSPLSAYIAETHYLNGTAKQASDFGEYDADSGIWIPKEYTDGGYGDIGFYYKYDNASSLGEDSSGEGHDASSLSNITAADQATDTPTNNFCTLNPLLTNAGSANYLTMTEGATKGVNAGNVYKLAVASMGVTSGKWYWEVKATSVGATMYMGITYPSVWDTDYTLGGTIFVDDNNDPVRYNASGRSSFGSAFGNGDIIAFALDMDASTPTMTVYKNNSSLGNLMSGLSIGGTGTAYLPPKEEGYFPKIGGYGAMTFECNFGGYTSGTPASGASDANGYGNFEYAPPSGYYALCTKNLAEYG
jgi:hypothetical protein